MSVLVALARPTAAGRRRPGACLVIAALAGLACTGPNPAFKPGDGSTGDRPAERVSDPPSPPPPVDAGDSPDLEVVADGAPVDELPSDGMVEPDAAAAPDASTEVPRDAASDPAAEVAVDVAPDLPTEVARDVAPDLPPDSSLSNGLVARYRLDPVAGTSIPDTTGTRNGTASGTISWPAGFPQAGFSNPGSLGLDGNTAYVTLPSSVLPSISAERSISLWYWLAAPRADLRRTLISINNSTTAGIQLGLQFGIPTVWVWNTAPASTVVQAVTPSPAGWTHIVYTHRAGAHVLYVNGVLVDSDTFSYSNATTTQVLLGAFEPDRGEEERWLGRIDDLRIFDRVLTASEVTALHGGAD